MKQLFLMLLFILPATLQAQVGVNGESILTTIVLKDVADSAIAGKALKIYTPEGGVASEGVTDASGRYQVRLMRGLTYTISFIEAGRDWDYRLSVTTDPAATFYTTTCRIDVHQGSFGTIVDGDKKCRLTLVLLDTAGKRMPGMKVMLFDLSAQPFGEHSSNDGGEIVLVLDRNLVLNVQALKGREMWSAEFTVPDSGFGIKEVVMKRAGK